MVKKHFIKLNGLIILMFLVNSCFCQLDTMKWNEEEYIIFNYSKRKKFGDSLHVLFQDEFVHYGANGIKLKELIYIGETPDYNIKRAFYPNGRTKHEIYRYGYDSIERKFRKNGTLKLLRITMNRTISETLYYDTGQPSQIVKYELLPTDSANLTVRDTVNNIIWRQIYFGNGNFPTETYSTEYYKNGNIKATGPLYPKLFSIRDFNNQIIEPRIFCKHGKWLFFKEDRTYEREIIYDKYQIK